MKKNRLISLTISFVLAAATCFSVFTNISVFTWTEHADLLKNKSLLCWGITGTLLILLYDRFFEPIVGGKRQFSVPIMALSILFSLLNLMGVSMYYLNSFNFILANSYQLVLSFVCATGYAAVFYVTASWLFQYFKGSTCCRRKPTSGGKLDHFFQKHPVFAPFLIILAGWLPWILAFYPGCVNNDVFYEMNQAYGYLPYSMHHPIAQTFLKGILYRVGKFIYDDDNFGMFFYTIVRDAACAYCYARMVEVIRKLGASYRFQCMSLLFLAVMPLCAGFSVALDNDVLYAAACALFLSKTILLIRGEEGGKRLPVGPVKWVTYGAVGLLCCLFKKNGIFVVVPTLVLLAILLDKKRRYRVLQVLAGLTVFFFSFNWVFTSVLGYVKDSVGEALSIPFQQTARYVKYHGGEVTEEEKSSINHILQYSLLKKIYTPGLSDPVKATYKKANQPDETLSLTNYFHDWIRMFFKHPSTYVQATVGNSYGYYAFTPVLSAAYGNDNTGLDGIRLSISNDPSYNSGTFRFHFLGKTKKIRIVLQKYLSAWNDIPFINLLYRCAFYTWLVAAMTCYVMVGRQRKKLAAFVPAVLSILICVASPVNDCFRYYLPVIMAMPLLIAFASDRGTGEPDPPEKNPSGRLINFRSPEKNLSV